MHDGQHNFRRSFGVNLASFRNAALAENTHSLQVGIELKATIDKATVPTSTLESKDHIGICVGLIQVEPSEKECLNLHRVSNKLLGGFYLDD